MPYSKFIEQIRMVNGDLREVRPPVSGEKLADKAHSIRSLHQSHRSASIARWEPIEELDHGESLDPREKEHTGIDGEDEAFILLPYRLCRKLNVHAEKDKVNSDCRAAHHQVKLWIKGIISQVAKQEPPDDVGVSLNLLYLGRISYLNGWAVDLDKVEEVHASPSH